MSNVDAEIVFRGDFAKIEADAQASAARIGAAYSSAINNALKAPKGPVGGVAPVPPAVTSSFSKLSSTINDSSRSLVVFGAAFVAFGKKSIATASGIVEALNAVNVAFGDSAGTIVNFSNRVADTEKFFGLTKRAALDATATLGLFFGEIGLGDKALAKFSESIVTSAADVGSLFNTNTNKVLLDFQAGLQGQTRAVRKYGLDISAASVETEAYRLGLARTGTELSENEKRYARLSLLLQASAVATGDAEKTLDTYAGAVRLANVNVANIQESFGKLLIPAAKNVLGVFNDLAEMFNASSDGAKLAALSLGLLATSLGVARAAAFAFGATLGPVGVSIAVVSAALAAAGIIISNVADSTDDLAENLSVLTDDALDAREKFRDFFNFDPAELGGAAIAQGKANIAGLLEMIEEAKRNGGRLDSGTTQAELTKDLTNQRKLLAAQNGRIEKSEEGIAFAVQNGLVLQARELIAQVEDEKVRNRLLKIYDKELKLRTEKLLITEKLQAEIEKDIQANKDSIEPMERLNRAFEESKKNIEALLVSQAAVTSAEKSLRDSKRSVAEAQERLNRLNREGAVDQDAVLQATQALTDATNRKLNADKNVLDVQKQLNEALKLATSDQIGEANDKILSSEIALAAAKRERLKAEKALAPAVRVNLNLAGKSLDQIRSLLAGERARLAAIAATADGEAPEDKAEKAITAAIGEREAERDLNEAKQDRIDLDKIGTEADEKVIDAREKLRDAVVALAKAEREGEDAAKKLIEVRKGDPDFNTNRSQAVQALADAKSNVADAEERLVTAQIRRIADEGTLAGNLEAGNKELAARLLLNRDLIAQQKSSAEFQAQFKALILRSGVIPYVTSPQRIDEIVQSLLNDPNSPFRAMFKNAGLPGYAEGTIVRAPVVARLGENFKPEAVVPLTDTNRSVTVLRNALPFMAPELQKFMRPALERGAGPGWAAPAGGVGRGDDRLDEMIALLRKIEQQKAGDVTVVMPPEAPTTKRELARAVRRELEGLL